MGPSRKLPGILGALVLFTIFLVLYDNGWLFSPENKSVNSEKESSVAVDHSQYVHKYEDTNYTGFDVSKARLNFLPYFKSRCWLEEPGENVYKSNLFVSNKTYPKRNRLGGKIPVENHQGVQIELYQMNQQEKKRYRLRCLPYFMLIGVAKSGTSDICKRIQTHPKIYYGTNKELYWWSQYRYDLLGSSLGDYADLFDKALHKMIKDKIILDNKSEYYPSVLGEFTSMTFYDFAYWRQNPANAGLKEPKVLNPYDIYKVLPNVKLIVILRNPTTRLYSHYNLFKRSPSEGHRRDGSPEDFHERVLGSIWWWETCIKKLPRRSCAFGSPPEMPYVYSSLGERTKWWIPSFNYSGEIRFGMYAIQAREWLNVFPRENILFLKMEEYSKDLEKAYNEQIFPFLGLEKLKGDLLKILIQKSIGFKRSYEPMLPKTKAILDEFYAPYNKELAELFQDKRWLWRD